MTLIPIYHFCWLFGHTYSTMHSVPTLFFLAVRPHILYHALCIDSILSGRAATRTLPCTLYRLCSFWPCGHTYSTMHSVPTLFFLAVRPHVLYHALCTDSVLSGRAATRTLPCTLYRLCSFWPCGHTYSTMHSVPTLFFLAVRPHVLYHALCTDSVLSGRAATRTLPCTLYRLCSFWPCGHTYSTMHSVPTLFFLAVWPHVLYHALCTDSVLSGRVATRTLPCTLYRLCSFWPCGHTYSTMHSVPTLFSLAVRPHALYHALCTDSVLSGRAATRTLPCTLYRLCSLWPCGHTHSTMHSVPTLFSLAVRPHALYHALCTDSVLSGRAATRTLPCTLYRLCSLWPCGHTYSTMHSVPTLFFLAVWPHALYHALCTDSILSGRVATRTLPCTLYRLYFF